MKKRDVHALTPGLYFIYWKTGGYSVGAVGINNEGERWIAPTNWSHGGYYDEWDKVSYVEAIDPYK